MLPRWVTSRCRMAGPYQVNVLIAAPEAGQHTSGMAPLVLSHAALSSESGGFTVHPGQIHLLQRRPLPRHGLRASSVRVPCSISNQIELLYPASHFEISPQKQSSLNRLIPPEVKHLLITDYRARHHLGLGSDLRLCL